MSLLPAETELDVKGRKLTGGMVLFMLVGFFATIIAVNMVLRAKCERSIVSAILMLNP